MNYYHQQKKLNKARPKKISGKQTWRNETLLEKGFNSIENLDIIDDLNRCNYERATQLTKKEVIKKRKQKTKKQELSKIENIKKREDIKKQREAKRDNYIHIGSYESKVYILKD